MKVNRRRPFNDEDPKGLLESDRDYVLNNIESCVQYLDSIVKRHNQREASAELCPDCGNKTVYPQWNGGIKCETNGCGYWFCY